MVKSFAMAKLSVTRYAMSPKAAGSTNPRSRCRKRRRLTLPRATKVPEPLPPLEDYTFEGYRNADGSVGTKNLLGITTSVHCMADVVNYVVKIIERNLLPKYPSIDGVVDLNHLYGCGVAINAPTAVVPIRTIHNIALNPNFGGEVMVVGLGCEKLQP